MCGVEDECALRRRGCYEVVVVAECVVRAHGCGVVV